MLFEKTKHGASENNRQLRGYWTVFHAGNLEPLPFPSLLNDSHTEKNKRFRETKATCTTDMNWRNETVTCARLYMVSRVSCRAWVSMLRTQGCCTSRWDTRRTESVPTETIKWCANLLVGIGKMSWTPTHDGVTYKLFRTDNKSGSNE